MAGDKKRKVRPSEPEPSAAPEMEPQSLPQEVEVEPEEQMDEAEPERQQEQQQTIEEEEEHEEEEPVEKILELLGKEQLVVLVKEAVSKQPELMELLHKEPAPRRIFVFNLDPDTLTAETITSVFGKYGEIEHCKATVYKPSGKFVGTAFILFKHRSGARKAIKQHQFQKKHIAGNHETAYCKLAWTGPLEIGPPPAAALTAPSASLGDILVLKNLIGEEEAAGEEAIKTEQEASGGGGVVREEEVYLEEEPVEEILELLGKDRLVVLGKDAVSKHPDLMELLHKLVDAGDPAHRRILLRIGPDATAETLTRVFGKYGEIEYCKVDKADVSGKSLGYAYILFKHSSEARKALKLPQKKNYHVMSCQVATRTQLVLKDPRQVSGGGYWKQAGASYGNHQEMQGWYQNPQRGQVGAGRTQPGGGPPYIGRAY